jgi:hypothetical protein
LQEKGREIFRSEPFRFLHTSDRIACGAPAVCAFARPSPFGPTKNGSLDPDGGARIRLMRDNHVVRWWLIRHRLRVIVHRIRFPGAPMFTASAAQELLGRRVIVGITNIDADGSLVDKELYDCQIVGASEADGLVLQTHTGDVLTLPPDLRGFFGAARGEYRFKSTGHVVAAPDLQTDWTRTLPRDLHG